MRPAKIFYPIGIAYGWVVKFRNQLYDNGWFKSEKSPLFSICVGNITAGGTGKTPMIEYLIKLFLKQEKNIAVLSRGYKRSTTGFLKVTPDCSSNETGDEPLQIASKFPMVNVFVDEKRIEGAKKIKNNYPHTDVLLLDDAFQHRSIKADINILLTRFGQLYIDDYYLPAGYLRDHKSRARQADIIVVSKCPANLSSDEKKSIEKKLNPNPNQQLFFSELTYNAPKLLFDLKGNQKIETHNLLVISGIAYPQPFFDYISANYPVQQTITYPDHYPFKKSDISEWKNKLNKLNNPAIITTEKDAVRLLPFKNQLKDIPVYYVSIETEFLTAGEEFDSFIIENQNKK